MGRKYGTDFSPTLPLMIWAAAVIITAYTVRVSQAIWT